MNIIIAYTSPFGLTVKVFRDRTRWNVMQQLCNRMMVAEFEANKKPRPTSQG